MSCKEFRLVNVACNWLHLTIPTFLFSLQRSPGNRRCRWGSRSAGAGRTCDAQVPGTCAGSPSPGSESEECGRRQPSSCSRCRSPCPTWTQRWGWRCCQVVKRPARERDVWTGGRGSWERRSCRRWLAASSLKRFYPCSTKTRISQCIPRFGGVRKLSHHQSFLVEILPYWWWENAKWRSGEFVDCFVEIRVT